MLYNGDDAPDQLGTADDVVFFRRDAGVDYEVFKYRYNSNNVTFTGNVGIGVANPTQKLTVAGTIESTSGGIKFPDGTTQTTASLGGQMQRGRIGTCTNNSTGTTGSVTFATAFSAIPIISVSPIELDNSGCTSVRIIAHSTTGFSWNSYVGGTLQACDCINWTAIEP